MAGQQLAQQQYAQNRYFDKVNEANARIGAGTQNLMGGISDIGTAGIMSGMGGKGTAETEDSNFGPNTVTGLAKLFGRKRSQYIGPTAQGVGFKQSIGQGFSTPRQVS
jgi:hypothetical protein